MLLNSPAMQVQTERWTNTRRLPDRWPVMRAHRCRTLQRAGSRPQPQLRAHRQWQHTTCRGLPAQCKHLVLPLSQDELCLACVYCNPALSLSKPLNLAAGAAKIADRANVQLASGLNAVRQALEEVNIRLGVPLPDRRPLAFRQLLPAAERHVWLRKVWSGHCLHNQNEWQPPAETNASGFELMPPTVKDSSSSCK